MRMWGRTHTGNASHGGGLTGKVGVEKRLREVQECASEC